MSTAMGGSAATTVGGSDPSGAPPEKPSRKFQKVDRTRRLWSHREEEILAATLVELVALGWKSDNGFRTGYLQRCEDSIQQEFPTSDIKGTPHVISKLTAWKTSYKSLRNILERTGVGFSSKADYKIDIDDEQWEHVVKVDPKAKFMRHKSWPLWETWKIIFRKDRATGGGAENISVAAARMRDSDGGGSQCDENDSQPPFVSVLFTDPTPAEEENIGDHISSGASDKQPFVPKTGGEKRRADSSDELLMDFLSNLHAETNSRLEVLSSPTETDSSDESGYEDDTDALDLDGRPTFIVPICSVHICCTLEIPFGFWRRQICMGALRAPVYFLTENSMSMVTLRHNDSKIWVRKEWKRFRREMGIVVGYRCHFTLVNPDEVTFYVVVEKA